MDTYDLFSRLGVALAIGLLVGLERGWRSRDAGDHERAAGFRTFALTGLLGGVAGLLAQHAGGVVVVGVFAVFGAAFTFFQWLEARNDKDVSATSTIAGMLTFLLGSLAVMGDLSVAIAAAVAMTGLLALREPLHRWVASLEWPEVRAVLVLLAMSFLLLPLLPDRSVDPFGVINPHEIWLLAILIASMSFAGYVAVRIFGDRAGIIVTAIAGGLASSTATTLALAKMARDRPAAGGLITAGILTAAVVMTLRVGIVAVALNPVVAGHLVIPLAVAGLVLGAGALGFLFRRPSAEHPKLQIDNPLALGSALRLAAVLVLVLLASEYLRGVLGNGGLMLIAGLSGITDVDATVISMARLGDRVAPTVAANAILVALAVNTVSKAIMATIVGGRSVGVRVGLISGLALTAGAVALWWDMAAG